MKTCSRPHCAIRSHKHEDDIAVAPITFAKYHNYLPKFCDIAERHVLNNQELIDNYIYLTNDVVPYKNLSQIIKNMLDDFYKEQNYEVRKLKALYVYTMISSPAIVRLRKTYLRLDEVIDGTYNRMLLEGKNDKDFINQLIFNYRMM